MEKATIAHRLPLDSAGYDDVKITASSVELTVDFGYGPKKELNRCSITFSGVLAFRFHDELHSDVPEEADGAIVEIKNSEWIEKLKAEEPPAIRGVEGRHHFGVFLSDHGYLEVIADEFGVVNRKD